eukprot:Gregarina_sp_Poly_1__7906@NODE_44_length_17989_cov_118_013391_g38_i0_p4_GENE_NODE_44_length_17989_cov_118_013391_g38_i0NODE_44_length_17989_cov_118_013391_g38_i0_p4_ORF_typecomplete_len361_score52_13GFO_IDH_MocA/PF01408_22/1_1e25GFO_IDH_MocA_C/PF02894_17/7_9e13NAD_binding_3/PF03447_16/4_3e06NAD_binding_3/PF03447_16/3_6e03DapB_N/PF01113_20/0_00011Sacchrp_dh_NADP/PF03435_18/0_18Sacchrp_dh_NADP/PF03435_18/1_6e04Semialdhyde_dh/PF01118_24/0_23Semialdhyde_dh/PF01118_24/1_2e04_NODE_44_length_17989_cov_
MTIQVALVGYGFVGKVFHVPYIKATQGLKLRLLGSRSAEASEVQDVEVVSDYDAVCTREEVDLVVVASPNATHYSLTKNALDNGKHVVCDKPFVVEINEARELIKMSKERQLLLAVFQNRRWDSDFLAIKRELREGSIGEPLLMYFNWERFRLEIRDRWREKNLTGSGIWYDLGPHMLDQVLCLFGLPTAISAHLAGQRQGAEVDDFAHVLLEYSSSLRVILNMSMAARPEFCFRYILHGSKGSVMKRHIDIQEDQLKEHVHPLDSEFGVDPENVEYVNGGEVSRESCPKGCQLQFYKQVAQAVQENRSEVIQHSFILAVVALLKAGWLSNESHRRWEIRELLSEDEIASINEDFAKSQE